MTFSASGSYQNRDITNNGFFPTIKTSSCRATVRLDGTVTDERLIEALVLSISEVNRALAAWQTRQQAAGYTVLTQVPAPLINGESELVAHYRRAVYALTKAELIERYRDVDTTKSGLAHAEAMDPEIDTYRRDARWAISDIQSKRRLLAELI